MTKQEFSGKTLDDAIDAAAKAFGIDRDSVHYSVLSTNSGGLFSKLFSRSIKIEAWQKIESNVQDAAREAVLEIMQKKHTSKPPEKKHPPKKREIKAIPKEYSTEEAATTAITTNLKANNILTLDNPNVEQVFTEFKQYFFNTFAVSEQTRTEARDNAGNVTISINDEFLEDMLSRSDKLSLAFDHLFKRVAQKKVGEIKGKFILTAGNSDKNREGKLKDYALSLAEKVKSSGRPITLSSKTNQERKVIHLSLDNIPGIATKSVGTGDNRRLIIFSTGAAKKRENTVRKPRANPNTKRRPRPTKNDTTTAVPSK